MLNEFILLIDLLFKVFHKFSDHLFELYDLIFHGIVKRKWFLKLIFEVGSLLIFLFDCAHKFVNDIIWHVNDLLFEEIEFRCECGEHSLKIK